MQNRSARRRSQLLLSAGRFSLLWIFLASCVSKCSADYDVCMDDESGTYLACQPGMFDVIWYQTFKLTLSPENSTCGTPPATYQRLGDRTGNVQTCAAASPSQQHPVTFMVDTDSSSWWQSINQPANTNDHRINITLSFNKTFILAGDINITFNSGRPDQMVLEKSLDYGLTWQPLQFYARNCTNFNAQLVPGASVTVDNPAAVICSNRFVEVVSSPGPVGKLNFPVDERFQLFLGPNAINFHNFYAALDGQMLKFLSFTDLRIRLLKPANDGRANYNMYYYAIADIQATAWCSCNLHASYCNYTETGVICDCQHNTMGKECDSCLPLYNERPWKSGSYLPYQTGTANECTKCECNDHAHNCSYNATYERGICQSCLDNTRGYHCQLCAFTYYPNVSLPLNDVNRCVECNCDLDGVFNNTLECAQEDSPTEVIGQCLCRPNIAGRRCDQCVPGFYGLKDGPPPGNCTACGCNLDGTLGQSNTCQQSGGQCPCKQNIVGRECGTCADGYFVFPSGNPQEGCATCDCDSGGSKDTLCDKVTGQCSCRANVTGLKCDQVTAGTFIPMVDTLTFEPQSGGCQVTSDRFTSDHPFDGPGFAVCDILSENISLSMQPVLGGILQKDVQWPYIVAVRYSTNTTTDWNITGTLRVQVLGDTQEDLSYISARLASNISSVCPLPLSSSQSVSLVFSTGASTACLSRSDNVTLDVRCRYSLTLELSRSESLVVGGGNSTNGTASDGGNTTDGTGTAGGNTTDGTAAGGSNSTNGTAEGGGNSTNGTIGGGSNSTNGTADGGNNSTNGTVDGGNNSTNGTADGGNNSTNGTADGGKNSTNGTADSSGGNSTNGTVDGGNNSTNGTSTPSSARNRRAADSASPITIDSVVLLPRLSSADGLTAFTMYSKSGNPTATQESYISCMQKVASMSERQAAMEQQPCRGIIFSVVAELNDGANACDCSNYSTDPSLPCQSLGGQCPCQPGVSGQTCDTCTPGYFNLTSDGCEPCPALPCQIPDSHTTTTTSTPSSPPSTVATNGTEKDNTTMAPVGGDNDSPLAAGLIVLIVFAIIAVIIIIIIVCILCWRRRKGKKPRETADVNTYHNSRLDLVSPHHHKRDRNTHREQNNIVLENSGVKEADTVLTSSNRDVELQARAPTTATPLRLMAYTTSNLGGPRANPHKFSSSDDVPLSHSSPKYGTQLSQHKAPSLHESRGPRLQHRHNKERSMSFDVPSERQIRLEAPANPYNQHVEGLNQWKPVSDLRLSDAEIDYPPTDKTSLSPSSDKPIVRPYLRNNLGRRQPSTAERSGDDPQSEEKTKRQSPQKPQRQKRPSLTNTILPPPPMYDEVSPDLDYEDQGDSMTLIPKSGKQPLMGYSNPVFIPEPDYPIFAGLDSFDEVNGSLV